MVGVLNFYKQLNFFAVYDIAFNLVSLSSPSKYLIAKHFYGTNIVDSTTTEQGLEELVLFVAHDPKKINELKRQIKLYEHTKN